MFCRLAQDRVAVAFLMAGDVAQVAVQKCKNAFSVCAAGNHVLKIALRIDGRKQSEHGEDTFLSEQAHEFVEKVFEFGKGSYRLVFRQRVSRDVCPVVIGIVSAERNDGNFVLCLIFL